MIVSWDEKKGEGVVDDSEKTDASGQMMDCGKLSQMTLLADAVSTTEDTSSEATETNVKQESVHNGCVRTLVDQRRPQEAVHKQKKYTGTDRKLLLLVY